MLDRVCRTRFRSPGDVNQYVMKYWQYMEGKYEPQSPKLGKFFTIGLHDRQIHDVLRNQKCKILCINDTENIGDFRQQKRNIKDSFESILPEKSAFELSYKDSGGMYDKKCELKIYGKAGLFRNDPALYRSFYELKTEQQVIGKLTVRFGKVKKNRLVFKNREMMDCTDNPEAFYEYLISSGYNKKI